MAPKAILTTLEVFRLGPLHLNHHNGHRPRNHQHRKTLSFQAMLIHLVLLYLYQNAPLRLLLNRRLKSILLPKIR